MPTLKPQAYASAIAGATRTFDAEDLAALFDLRDSHARYLWSSLAPGENQPDYGRPTFIDTYSRKLQSPWSEMAIGHTQALISLNDHRSDPVSQRSRPDGDAINAFTRQHEVVNALYRWMMSGSTPNGWALPTLYSVCRDLKGLAALADVQRAERGEKPTKLEEASRKMGTYYMATLLFKTYFKLKSTALCKNIIKGIGAADLAPFDRYPLAHQVTYHYYMGVFAFLREDYAEAEALFLRSLRMTHIQSSRNIELILDYLIPCLLLRGVLPSHRMLSKSPRLSELYRPFVKAFRTGDVALFDEQLSKGEKRLMERGTYLVVERAREGAVRGLMKKGWILEGKPARMSIDRFQWYFQHGAGMEIDSEEVECLIATMIHKGLIKGYISHAHQMVVLSKDKPFPWYDPFVPLNLAGKAERSGKEAAERNRPGFVRPVAAS